MEAVAPVTEIPPEMGKTSEHRGQNKKLSRVANFKKKIGILHIEEDSSLATIYNLDELLVKKIKESVTPMFELLTVFGFGSVKTVAWFHHKKIQSTKKS